MLDVIYYLFIRPIAIGVALLYGLAGMVKIVEVIGFLPTLTLLWVIAWTLLQILLIIQKFVNRQNA